MTSGSGAYVVALVLGITPAFLSLAIAFLSARWRRQEKLLDWDRQDKLNRKLNIIHELVNSQMTAALRSELGAVRAQLVMMREMMDIRRGATGTEPSAETLAVVKALEVKVKDQEAVIAEREKTQAAIDHLETTGRISSGDDNPTRDRPDGG